jgi:predicted transposase YbfD/YdcC
MRRLTQAQQLTQATEEQAQTFFEEVLRGLRDPRRPQGVRYPLRSVVVIALMAMVCGCDDAEAMEVWGEANAEWLGGFLSLPHGTPTQDVFLAVFGALQPEAFSAVFRAWAQWLALRLQLEGKHLAVDGKTSRRSFDTAQDQPAIHTVSAWLSEAGLVLGQRQTGAKSNEITAIPELLRTLDLHGTTVTIDAMGCQTAIAATIVGGGGDYLLAVKDNQPTLHQDLQTTFAEAADARRRTCDEAPAPLLEEFTEVDKGHGRVEQRTVKLCRDLTWVTQAAAWDHLAYVVQITRERTVLATQQTSVETAYYIGSAPQATAKTAAAFIRRHWGVENQLHWVLDLAFHEDQARHRARNTAQNFTTLRHFALNIIKQDPDRKLGVANSRRRAGFDRKYLIHLLTHSEA